MPTSAPLLAQIDVDTMSAFLATLALASLVGALGCVALVIAARGDDTANGIVGLRADVRRWALGVAFLVATVATAGSLYYSEIEHYVPCRYCWYQRIAMYPLMIILGIAAVLRDRRIRLYVLPLALIGAAISSYHYLLQRYPDAGGGSCDAAAPCTLRYVWQFDFVSIPFMAGCGFLLIAALMLAAGPTPRLRPDRPAQPEE